MVCAAALGVGVVCLTAAWQHPPATYSIAVITPSDAAAVFAAPDIGELNLNSADKWALIDLPGIGPALAQRILEYRELVGAFTHESELIRVNGIGEKTSEKLYPLVYVGE